MEFSGAVTGAWPEGWEPAVPVIVDAKVEVAVEVVVEGAAVDVRLAVAEAQYSLMRAASSPEQVVRSQEHLTSGLPAAMQVS